MAAAMTGAIIAAARRWPPRSPPPRPDVRRDHRGRAPMSAAIIAAAP
jgi:hypothetical protein